MGWQPVPGMASPAPASNGCADLIRLAALGAVIGGAVTGAREIQRARNGEIEQWQATTATARGTLVAGAATALAGGVANLVAEQGIARLAIMFAGGMAAAYGLNAAMERLEKADG